MTVGDFFFYSCTRLMLCPYSTVMELFQYILYFVDCMVDILDVSFDTAPLIAPTQQFLYVFLHK